MILMLRRLAAQTIEQRRSCQRCTQDRSPCQLFHAPPASDGSPRLRAILRAHSPGVQESRTFTLADNSTPHLPSEITLVSEELVRGMGLVQSTAVNMLE